MKVSREERFDPNTFSWSKNAKKTIRKIKAAGKMDLLEQFFDERFGNHVPHADQVDMIVSRGPEEVLDACGLDKNGRQKKTKKFEVYVRIEGVVREEADAETPEEAAKKVIKSFNEGDPLITLLRDEVDLMKPVAYNDGDGQGKEYPEYFDVEEM